MPKFIVTYSRLIKETVTAEVIASSKQEAEEFILKDEHSYSMNEDGSLNRHGIQKEEVDEAEEEISSRVINSVEENNEDL
jgi:hypothetical protein